jgi:uncharacterized cupin superfamily protein
MPKPSIIPVDPAAVLEDWPPFSEAEIASGARAQKGLVLFEDKARGLSVGLWEMEANESHELVYPINEFMLLLEGEVLIEVAGRRTRVGPGQSFYLPKGLRGRWIQPGRVRKIFVTFDDAGGVAVPDPLKMFLVDPKVSLAPSAPPSADVLLSPVPTQHTCDVFEDASGQLSIGVWDTTGYRRKLIDFPRHELMHLIEGSVTFTDDAGRTQTFRAGDTFFVPLGTPNAWASEGYLRKIFVIFQPRT